MGRPAKHSVDDFVDAAIDLFARHGIRAVTLSAVAESIGAANGSIYHRFPDRPTLLAAMWLRTETRFVTEYRTRLGEPTIGGAIAAAVWIVEWCRDNDAQAQVLLAGARTFTPGDRPSGVQSDFKSDNEIRREIGVAVAQLTPATDARPDEIAFAMLQLPIAVVRGTLEAGRVPGDRESELVKRLTTRILTPRNS